MSTTDTNSLSSRGRSRSNSATITPPTQIPDVDEEAKGPTQQTALISAVEYRWRGRDVVFVDPLDYSVPYWWPAMIVPTDEIDATMGCLSLGPEEYLVKYFEDFKYSTVKGSELRLFDTSQPPFTDFAATSPSFLRDKAIKGALSYLRTGLVHTKFQWRLWQTGSETIVLPFTLQETATGTAHQVNMSLVPLIGGDADIRAGNHVTYDQLEASSAAVAVAVVEEEDEDGGVGSDGSPLTSNALLDSAPMGAENGRLPKQQQQQRDGQIPDAQDDSIVEKTKDTTEALHGEIMSKICDVSQVQTPSADQPPSPSLQPIVPSEDADDANEADDEDAQQQQRQLTVDTPASTATADTTPEITTPQPTARNRRPRAPRPNPTTVAAAAALPGTGGRRGRPPLASKLGQVQAKHKRNASSIGGGGGNSGSKRQKEITPALDDLNKPSDVAAAAPGGESSEIRDIVKNMEEVQEEYRFYRALVRRAAKDLWTEMGNEWPPNLGTSTRFGKRRKIV
ncbi:hypothetical protein BX661DRAFT_187455 [Kickxella alabastrina]|uniref:uncharacterized protein n=1 Tax=Kickxella alabastrina TaxID=61397 RepID=UPI00221FE6FA|nr:uncharacterized protein BX661DRAFT_187455 [Kickxella alabastrina]KAI7822472.1 hypothetical protein BX661DRAFT_187455 [Kickxella alabastrina]